MKKVIFIMVLIACQYKSISQNTTTKNSDSIPSIVEKVYLHTDRSYFNLGESLWYKAYLTEAKENKLINHSNLLYVELVSADSTIVKRNNTFISNGVGHGDFMLTDSVGVSAGTYQLRAYTNWMRNFKDNFIFKKEIEVVDLNEKKELDSNVTKKHAKKQKAKENFPTIVEDKAIDLQFFPEGGSLISGVPATIAFKATDKNGFPINVEGSIFNSNKTKVASFKSTHYGMGKFTFIPSKNDVYVAETTNLDKNQTSVQFPTVEKYGFSLDMRKLDKKIIGSIKTNQETLKKKPNSTFRITLSIRGEIYFEGAITVSKSNAVFLLPTENIPSGIAHVTIYDEEGKPHSERLIYINNENNNLNVTVNSDKNEYNIKEKVNITVSAKTTEGTAIPASFSLAVTDSNSLDPKSDNSMNICSYFLMQSDIKGKVYNPGYYFNTANADRFQKLDLLLLTQGWRDFIWKKNANLYSKKLFNAEKGFSISGRVKKLFASKAKQNNDVYLYYVNQEKSNLKLDVTDSLGKFEFKNLLLVGKTGLRLSVKDKKNRKKGMIVMDTLNIAPLPIDFKNLKPIVQEKSKKDLFKENLFKKFVEFDVPLNNQLDEVLIVGTKKDEEDRNEIGFSDYSYDASKDDTNFTSIYELIQFSIPGTVVFNDTLSFRRNNGGPALIIVDEIETESTDLGVIPATSVAKIEALIGANAGGFGPRGVNGVILIYTKTGEGITTEKRKFHTITKIIDGFYNARDFYSPNYDVIKGPTWNETADIRNTLYWNPYIHPDKDGNVKVSYFNSEVPTNVNITLEGITTAGTPIVVKSQYKILK